MNQSSHPAFLINTTRVNMRMQTTTKEIAVKMMVTTTVGTTTAGMNILLYGWLPGPSEKDENDARFGMSDDEGVGADLKWASRCWHGALVRERSEGSD
jgi:hypothetical protein